MGWVEIRFNLHLLKFPGNKRVNKDGPARTHAYNLSLQELRLIRSCVQLPQRNIASISAGPIPDWSRNPLAFFRPTYLSLHNAESDFFFSRQSRLEVIKKWSREMGAP